MSFVVEPLGQVYKQIVEQRNQVTKFTHVLSVCHMSEGYDERMLKYWINRLNICHKIIQVYDDDKAQLLCHLTGIIKWIEEEAFNSSASRLVIHCYEGNSRSVTVACALLMKRLDYNIDQALSYVRSNGRPNAYLKPAFRKQLLAYEEILSFEKCVKELLVKHFEKITIRIILDYLN